MNKNTDKDERKLAHGASSEFNLKEDSITLVVMIAMCIVQAIAINGFYVPNKLLSGGVTGISLLFTYLFNIPSYLSITVLNIPILIIGFIYFDKKFAFMSLIGTVLFTVSIALTSSLIKFPEIDPILSAITGGAIVGICSAPVVRRNTTLGGMDVIAMLLSKKLSIPMGTFNIFFNLVIMSVLGIINGLELAILSILAMFVCNVAFNYAVVGLNRTHTVFIISDEWDDIAPMIMKDMNRGVTYIPAEGAYKGKQKKVVYCIVKTVELARIKRIVLQYDSKALFSVIDTKEVIGRGFGAVN